MVENYLFCRMCQKPQKMKKVILWKVKELYYALMDQNGHNGNDCELYQFLYFIMDLSLSSLIRMSLARSLSTEFLISFRDGVNTLINLIIS